MSIKDLTIVKNQNDFIVVQQNGTDPTRFIDMTNRLRGLGGQNMSPPGHQPFGNKQKYDLAGRMSLTPVLLKNPIMDQKARLLCGQNDTKFAYLQK